MRTSPYPIVRLTGVPDAASVRATLLDALARQPVALLADTTGRDPGDLVAVLTGIARETADWPAATLVVISPEPVAWTATGLPVWPSVEAATAALGEPDDGQRLDLALAPELGAARRSRELVTEACTRWKLPELAGPACIVVTEMVNNVVAHARTPMSVLLARHGRALTVAVRDDSPVVPRYTGPAAVTAYGGRGLQLIEAVAERWGSLELASGKVVWALLPGE